LLTLSVRRSSYLDAVVDDVLGADVRHANIAKVFSSWIEFAVITVLDVEDCSKRDELSNFEPSPSRGEFVRVIEQRQPYGWFHAPRIAFSSGRALGVCLKSLRSGFGLCTLTSPIGGEAPGAGRALNRYLPSSRF
jgi:hypothetical protein